MAHNPNEAHKGTLCEDGSWAVNGTGIYYPICDLAYDNESIQGKDSGRTEDGTMHIEWVAEKYKIYMNWPPLTGHEVKHLKDLMFAKQFTFSFVDLGEHISREMYCTKMSYTQVSQDDGFAAEGGVYNEVSANLIEI